MTSKKGPKSNTAGNTKSMKDFEKTAAVYVRWSSKEKTDENRGDQNMSLAAQKVEAEKYALSLGYKVVKIYSEPLGTSVSKYSNKETKVFNQALEEMGTLYHTLVMDEGTRFTREHLFENDLRTITTLNKIRESGGRLISRDGFDTDDLESMGGRLKLMVQVEIAAAESEKLSFRSRRGKEEMARRNLCSGGAEPYGLKAVKYDDRPTDLERVPEECEVAKRIFDMLLAGASTNEVAQVLNKEGVPTKTGGNWQSSMIARLARRPHWIGHRYHKGDVTRDENGEPYMCQWGQIIDPAKFYAVQEIFKGRAQKRIPRGPRNRRYKGVSLLSALCKCGDCGFNMHTNFGQKTEAEKNRDLPLKYQSCVTCKPRHSVNAHMLEDYIVTEALTHLAKQDPNSDMVTEVARQWLHKHSVGSLQMQSSLHSEAVSIQARIDELSEWYFVDQKINKEQFDELTTTLQGKLAAVEAELATSGAVEELDVSPLFDLLQSSDEESLCGEGSAWSQLPLYEQRVILNCIVDNVVVDRVEGWRTTGDKIPERTTITFNTDAECIEKAVRADQAHLNPKQLAKANA